MTGLDGAGKSTIAGRLIHGTLVETLPTTSFELGVMNFDDNTWIELWDIGKYGEVAAKTYIPHSEGLIFVVDSTDRERLPEATEKLHGLLKKASRPVVLVLANKQDSPGALTPPSLADQMRLDSIRRAWHIKGTSAIEERGGVYEGIEWLRNAMQVAQHPIQQGMIRKRRRQRGFCESRRGLP
ncbi:P-loop containing nucleoside triphosphate hydrolase protein [Exidia glandulosa HHB12029]|uniref:p-loop containing nucleoside triphosphate hydrolase protein n=1 Tax=Exidia glandulosa HHB12029 TaxID=1314781 RepID=A0A165QJZ2_EXIGL|nr:P-loop containing nucleoside triphosphate hydrolase protein [Exidia glandulosa HHB12029]